MKKIAIITIAIETLLLLFLANKHYKLNESYLQQCELLSQYEKNKFIVEDEESLFWNLDEDSVAEKLPKPLWHGEVKIIDDGEWVPPPYERYLSIVEGSQDTITIHPYRWHNPFSNRTNIEIVFEEIEGRWIATSCLEYDPNEVNF